MILSRKDRDPSKPFNPLINYDIKVWYEPGGGGNWLCYLIWCWYNNKIIPGDHLHFAVSILIEVDKSYTHFLHLMSHQTKWQDCDIVFGSPHYHYNRFIMNYYKNRRSWDLSKPDIRTLSNIPERSFDLEAQHNLDWSLLALNPPEFINQLNQFIPLKIEWNDVTRESMLQYLYSSYPEGYRGLDYRNHGIFSREIDRIHYTQTPDNYRYETRREMAWEIFDQHWVKWDPETWDF